MFTALETGKLYQVVKHDVCLKSYKKIGSSALIFFTKKIPVGATIKYIGKKKEVELKSNFEKDTFVFKDGIELFYGSFYPSFSGNADLNCLEEVDLVEHNLCTKTC